MAATHEVLNQSTLFVDRNLFAIDRHCRKPSRANAAEWDERRMSALGGRQAGSRKGRMGDVPATLSPKLEVRSHAGVASIEVEFHPAVLARCEAPSWIGAGLHASGADPRHAQVARAAI